jgi:hypothetical protein
MIHRPSLKTSDRDRRFVQTVEHAGSFAQHFDRANTGTGKAQYVGIEDSARRTIQISGSNLFDEPRHVDMRGTRCRAGCIVAVKAPPGFQNRGLRRQRGMKIVKSIQPELPEVMNRLLQYAANLTVMQWI